MNKCKYGDCNCKDTYECVIKVLENGEPHEELIFLCREHFWLIYHAGVDVSVAPNVNPLIMFKRYSNKINHVDVSKILDVRDGG